MAEKPEAQDTETTETIDQEEEVTLEEESTEASADDDSTEETEDPKQDQEFEVVLESTGSQPKPAITSPISIGKRINKLNAKVDSARQGEEKANTELLLANERNRLLQLQLEQRDEAQNQPVMPNVDEFDGGVHDSEYVKKYQEYQGALVQKEITRQVQEATQQTVQTNSHSVQSQDLERKQVKHYEQANKLGMKNYAEAEDKAIEILGTKTVNVIIDNFVGDSHLLLGYLGVNPDKAQAIADKIQFSPIQGIADIGALRSQLKVKPKTKITPNPDTPLHGGSPSSTEGSQRRLEKMRDEAGKNPSQKTMGKILEFKKKMREKGITLR